MKDENKEDDIVDIKQTWKKVENVLKKTGLRNGISDGRDSSFQEYFDIGFKEGFRNGYALGKYKGALVAHSRQTHTEVVEHPLLKKINRGECEICKNEELLETDVAQITAIQTDISNKNISELHSTFSKMINSIELPNEL